jgi:hypothetical protein
MIDREDMKVEDHKAESLSKEEVGNRSKGKTWVEGTWAFVIMMTILTLVVAPSTYLVAFVIQSTFIWVLILDYDNSGIHYGCVIHYEEIKAKLSFYGYYAIWVFKWPSDPSSYLR